MSRTNAKPDLEYLETSEDARAAGLRRIKRRHFTKPGEVTLKNCQLIATVKIDADVYNFLESKSESGDAESIEKTLNAILREAMEKTKLREELLNDTEFVERLKEKLAA